MSDSQDRAGSHTAASAQADRPLRERLKTLATEQSLPIMREAMADSTAEHAQESLVDELQRVVGLLASSETDGVPPTQHDRYRVHLDRLRADLSAELGSALRADRGAADEELARELAREFASAFWSAMLDHMRGRAHGSEVPAAVLLDALPRRKGQEAPLSDVGREFGLNGVALARAGTRILRAAAQDSEMARLSGDGATVRFPFGLEVTRADIERELERHMFDHIDITGMSSDLRALQPQPWVSL